MADQIEEISQREFARRDGCDPKLVRIAISDGHLTTLPSGNLNAALVGSGWRRTNRRGGEKVGNALSKVRKVPTRGSKKLPTAQSRKAPVPIVPLPNLATCLASMADCFANDAAVVLLRHVPEAVAREAVAELVTSARRGAVALLEEDGVDPPTGTAIWSDHRIFTEPVPTEHEWQEAAIEAGRGA